MKAGVGCEERSRESGVYHQKSAQSTQAGVDMLSIFIPKRNSKWLNGLLRRINSKTAKQQEAGGGVKRHTSRAEQSNQNRQELATTTKEHKQTNKQCSAHHKSHANDERERERAKVN